MRLRVSRNIVVSIISGSGWGRVLSELSTVEVMSGVVLITARREELLVVLGEEVLLRLEFVTEVVVADQEIKEFLGFCLVGVD